MQTRFDFIIVGAGTAGIVLAYRLLMTGKFSILLVEEGEEKRNPYLKVPLAVGKVLTDNNYVWPYYTDEEKSLNNRRIYSPMGKVLGGSSSINGTVFARGPKAKYDEWRDLGCEGFDYNSLDKYFRSIEKYSIPSEGRGDKGLLNISRAYCEDKLSQLFMSSCKALGYPKIEDYNCNENEGVSSLQYTNKNGLRSSLTNTYFEKIRNNKNLYLLSKTSVKELLFKGNKVLGCCVIDKSNKEINYYANYEVIVCGGAIQTPALLQRSGIGDPKILRDLGIRCLVDLPSVGRGLKDHANVRASFTLNSILTLNNYLSNYFLFSKLIFGYLIRRRNLLATPSATSHLLIKSTPEIEYPDLKLQLVHMIESKRFGVGKNTKLSNNSGFSIGVSYIFPKSSGSVKITSRDYTVPPSIHANYLSETHDQNKTIHAIDLARKIVSKSPLKDYIKKEVKPGERKKSKEDILNFAKENCQSGYHFSCSCRMGTKESGVVDNKFKVYGVNRLRLCDASVLPFLTSSNIQAIVMVLAEKAASEIINDYA